MEISREDLLKQKASLEQQLQWVNRMLAESDASADSPAKAPSNVAPESPPAATPPQTPFPQPNPAPTPPPVTNDTSGAFLHQQLESQQSSSAGTFSTGQKLGCAAVAVGVCVGILFALFVLPYFLY